MARTRNQFVSRDSDEVLIDKILLKDASRWTAARELVNATSRHGNQLRVSAAVVARVAYKLQQMKSKDARFYGELLERVSEGEPVYWDSEIDEFVGEYPPTGHRPVYRRPNMESNATAKHGPMKTWVIAFNEELGGKQIAEVRARTRADAFRKARANARAGMGGMDVVWNPPSSFVIYEQPGARQRPNPSKSSCKSYVSKQIRRQYHEGKVGSGKGKRSRKQAIAIAFSKAEKRGCDLPRRNNSAKTFEPGDIVRHTAKWRRSVGMYAGGPINGVVLGQHPTIPEWCFVAWSDGHGTWVAKANIEHIPSKKRVGTAELAALSKQYHAKMHEKNPKAAAKRNPQPISVNATARRLMRA